MTTRICSVTSLLDQRVARLLDRIRAEPFWKAIVEDRADPALVQRIMKEVYLEIYWYQADVIEATMHIIGQFPRVLPEKKIKVMLMHQAEEWDHGEMALRDYVNAGGSEEFIRTSRPSPSAESIAAFWTYLAKRRDPFAYLGALYLFEGLTPIVTGLVKPRLLDRAMPADALEYVEFHSTEDLKHQAMVKRLIDELSGSHECAAAAMLHGYDSFEYVYPLDPWRACYERACNGGSEHARRPR